MPRSHTHRRVQLCSLIRLILAIIGGGIALISLLGLFAATPPHAQAAPKLHPLMEIFTGTISITHTSATTHEMVVFGNGRITNQFLTDNITSTGTATHTNQIGPSAAHNTIAVRFDQHLGNNVDIGSKDEFTMSGPITLETESTFPGALEDTYAVYTSQSLSYQITQRTLALSSNNCVLMEFFILNTGSDTLTGGKFLFMLDTQVGELPVSESGGFDATRNLLYQTDYNTDTDNGYAVGISLLEGSLRGYGAINIGLAPDPTAPSETNLRNEMESPLNSTSGNNNVIWLVANIPDLAPAQEAKLVFSLCARSSYIIDNELEAENQARQNLFLTFSKLVNLEVSKTATPPSGSSVVAGEPLTYTIAVTSAGEIYVDNIVITDRVPLSTSLLGYSVSQGSITAANGLVTATVGRLYPTSQTVTMSLVVAPQTSLLDGTVITNQAFIQGQPIVTQTNVVSHQLIGVPAFSLSKAGQSSPAPVVGLPFAYTLTVTNTGGITETNIEVVDPLPANANYVSGGTLGPGNGVSWTIPSLAAREQAQVSYVVTTCQVSLVNNNYQVISSTKGITSAPGPELVSALASPTITPNFSFSPLQPGIGQSASFTGTSTTNSTPIVSWTWNFGDGATGSGQTSSHAYTAPGNYPVALTVTDSCNYQATVTETVTTLAPNLVVTKQASPEPVPAGSRLVYTITLANEGPVEATGVEVFDPAPEHTTFVPGSLVFEPSSIEGPDVPPVLISDLTLTPGFRVTATYQLTVTTPLTSGTLITNSVSISSSQIPTPTIVIVTSTVSSSPELALTKSSTHPTPLQPGDMISYTLTLRNDGNANTTGGVISDSLPANTDFVAGSITLNPPTAGQVGTAPPLLANNVNLVAGETLTVTYRVTVRTPLTNGTTLTNTASVTSVQTPAPITATVVDIISSSPNLSVNKTSGYAAPLNPGETLTYTIVISNNGNANATSMVISDSLPANTSFVAGSIALNPPTAGQVGTAPPLLASEVNLVAGEGLTVTYQVTVRTPLTNGITITNTAAVTSVQTPAPVTATVVDTISSSPSLSVNKTSSYAVPLNPGETLTYTIIISNDGNTNATEVVISDSLPANTDFVAGSITLNPPTAGQVGTAPPLLADNLNLAVEESLTVTYRVTVRTPLTNGTTLTNTAAVTSAQTPTPTTATVVDTVSSSPVLAIRKTASYAAPLNPGETLTYTIIVSNTGSANATGGVISDSLPANLSLVPGSLDLDPDSAGTLGSFPLLVTNLGVSAGQRLTLTFAAVVASPLANGTIITNTASVTSQEQLLPQASTVTATVVATPNIQVEKSGPISANVSTTVVYTFTVTNGGNTPLQGLQLVDDHLGPVTDLRPGSDSNNNNQLDLTEMWVYTGSYTIPPNAPNFITNTVEVTATDGLFSTATDTDSHVTRIAYNPILALTKTGPASALVGNTVVFTFRVSHGAGSDNSAVREVTVNDDVAGPATFVGGDSNNNSQLDASEVWTYQVSYVIAPTNPTPLINTGIVTAKDQEAQVVTAIATHTMSLSGFEPVLFIDKDGPAMAEIGETVIYTITVINVDLLALTKYKLEKKLSIAAAGDGSRITIITVTDKLAANVTYLQGDNGNGVLDGGEAWTYRASHTITPADPDPLINLVTIEGVDQENEPIKGSDTHSTNISQNPILEITYAGPATVQPGQQVEFTFRVKHTGGSDKTEVKNITVKDSLAGLATRISGDDNNNGALDLEETWVYVVSYLVSYLSPNPLTGVVTVEGRDLDNEVIKATGAYSLPVTDSAARLLLFPILQKH